MYQCMHAPTYLPSTYNKSIMIQDVIYLTITGTWGVLGYDVIYHLFDRSTPVNRNFSNFHNTHTISDLGARILGRQVSV